MTVIKDIEIPASPEGDSRAHLGTRSTEDLPDSIQNPLPNQQVLVYRTLRSLPYQQWTTAMKMVTEVKRKVPIPVIVHQPRIITNTTLPLWVGIGGNDVWTNSDLLINMDR
jgi:hypothetical protein